MVRRPTPAALARAAALLRKGEVVAFPTETVYGLGANALDEEAVRKVFALKGRPDDNPLIAHVADRRMLARLVTRVPPAARALADRFWPGPLTLVLPKRPSVPDTVTAGLPTVAVRMPSHPVALALIRAAGVPLAAPSANRSGRPSPTTAAHVAEDFPGLLVLDGGPCAHGLESSVVALEPRPRLLRPGAIPLEALRELVPDLTVARRRAGQPVESPGLKYRHYAPSRPLVLYRPSRVAALIADAAADPHAVVLGPDVLAPHVPAHRFVPLGTTAEEIGRSLFAALRTDRPGSVLLVLGLRRSGVGRTVMDRLERAATRVV